LTSAALVCGHHGDAPTFANGNCISWPALGLELGVDHKTAKKWTIAALNRLAESDALR
jgi:hypothetical protein